MDDIGSLTVGHAAGETVKNYYSEGADALFPGEFAVGRLVHD